MGWWITLGVLAVLALLPLGVWIRYDDGGLKLRIVAGPVRLQLLPKKKKKDKPKAKNTAPNPAPETESPPAPKSAPRPEKEEKKGGSVTDFLPLVKTGLDFLGSFRRKLRVNVLEVKFVMGGGDPCDLAVNYGKAWAGLGNLMPLLERFLVIQKRDVQIECDFNAGGNTVFALVQITITLGRLLGLLVWYGIRLLIDFLKIQKKRKGGATL